MPFTQEMLALFAQRAATAWVVITYLGSMTKLFGFPETYPFAHVVISAVTFTGAVAWCLYDCLKPGRVWGSRVFLVVALANAVAYLRWNTPVPGTGYPALHAVITSGLLMAAVAVGPRRALVVVAVLSAILGGERIDNVGVAQAIGETAVFAGTGIAGCGIYYFLQIAVARIERVSTQTWMARQRATLEEHRANAREHWDRLVHDKVLGALRLAGTGRLDNGAQSLAAEALASIDGGNESGPVPSLATGIPAIASRLGLRLTMSGDAAVVDPTLRSAILSATEQAMTNVQSHSGQRAVTVTVSRDNDDTDVVNATIRDPGRGFTVEDVRADRRGLTHGVIGALQAVGGAAHVSSVPGLGTKVVLSVRERDDTRADAPDTPADLRAFAPMIGVGAFAIAAHTYIGILHLSSVRSILVSVLCMLLIPALSLAVAVAPPLARYFVPLGLLASTIPFLLTRNLRDPAAGNWDTWYIGALLPLVGAIGFRFSVTWGAVCVAFSAAGAAAAQAMTGPVNWAELSTAFPALVAIVLAAALSRRGFEATAAYVTEASAEQGRLAIEQAAAQARTVETEARSAALRRDVGPMLRRITTAERLDDADRRRCLELEAAARDQLVAAPLMDEPFAEQVLDARRRDIDVEITSTGSVPEPDAAAFREVAAAVLAQADAHSHAVLMWRPRPSGALGTVTLIDDQPRHDVVVAAVRRALAEPAATLAATVTDDEDALQVELRAAAAPPRPDEEPSGSAPPQVA